MEVSTMEMKKNFNKHHTMKPTVLLISMHNFFKKGELDQYPHVFILKSISYYPFLLVAATVFINKHSFAFICSFIT